ncbi:uncharacterized protein UTRI_10400 [Ustilago trichophora]|uniref:Effector family protein Eff1 n=1 Tax=Ustilago trichophora TaxID=86804 RepID=A0A5C3E9C1_9BASI|nr:uncharacterized protein UTRI_10400 [Ustilago trichophora]
MTWILSLGKMRSIGPSALFIVVLTATFAVAMDEEPQGSSNPEPRVYTQAVFIPEHHFYPVQESDAAYGGEPGWELRRTAPTRSNRLIGILPDLLRNEAEDHGADLHRMSLSYPSSSAFPANQAPRPNLASSWQPGQGFSSSVPDRTTTPRQPDHPGSSYQASDIRQPLEQQQGRAYTLGSDKFSMHTYPLDLPAFKHLYNDGASFENFEDHFDGRQLLTRGTLFRPDPEVLRAIQHKIWQQLAKSGIQTKPVDAAISLHEGEYLWPPVEALHPFVDRLGISSHTPVRKMRAEITHRLLIHSVEEPRLFRMDVQVGRDTRHILTFPVRHAEFDDGLLAAPGSKPWLFYEGVMHDGTGIPSHKIFRLAVLGSTYLPQGTDADLRAAGILKVAFLSAAQAPLH